MNNMIPQDYTTKLFFETKNIDIFLFKNCLKTKKLEKKLLTTLVG